MKDKVVKRKRTIKTNRSVRLLDVKSDLVFKKIFGQHSKLVKSFLNSVLPLPPGNLIETIHYLTPEQSPRIPILKNTIVDVKCTDEKGRIFIVEMQLSWSSSFMKRFLFGASKAFVQQMEKGKTYGSLCPVYGLAILNENFKSDVPDWYHHYRLSNVNNLDDSLEGLELVFVELQKFKPLTFEHRRLGVLWLRFLREINESLSSIPAEFQEYPDLAKAVELAQESYYTKEELILYDAYLDALSIEQTVREDSEHVGLEKGIETGIIRGRAEGIVEGRAEGRAEGITAGRAEAAKELARKLINDGMSLDKVAELTGLTIEDFKELQ